MTQAERMRRASKSRREHEQATMQRAILQAAAEVFWEHGYAGFSMRQVAARLSYTVGTLYHYYDNKDALLYGVLTDAFAQLDEVTHRAASGATLPLARIRAICAAYVGYGIAHPAAYHLMFLERPEFALRSQSHGDPTTVVGYRVIYQAVATAMVAGVLRPAPPLAITDALWAQVHGIVALAIRMPDFFDPARTQVALDTALDSWENALRAAPEEVSG